MSNTNYLQYLKSALFEERVLLSEPKIAKVFMPRNQKLARKLEPKIFTWLYIFTRTRCTDITLAFYLFCPQRRGL
jgi:hypothetical protein